MKKRGREVVIRERRQRRKGRKGCAYGTGKQPCPTHVPSHKHDKGCSSCSLFPVRLVPNVSWAFLLLSGLPKVAAD